MQNCGSRHREWNFSKIIYRNFQNRYFKNNLDDSRSSVKQITVWQLNHFKKSMPESNTKPYKEMPNILMVQQKLELLDKW
jgi:hypothetical protein